MAMRMSNIRMTTTVERKKLLETLKTNLEQHARIVKEAREGYVRKAKAALEKRLGEILEGNVVNLVFSLSPPQDYTEVYKNSIEMLEWNTEEKVELEADEFRQLVRDEWDWTDTFYAANRSYSATAARLELEKGGGGAKVDPDFGGSRR